MTQLACLICGADTGEITLRLVEWVEPIAGRRYDSLPRCRDIERCWSRVVTVLVEDWPVNDGRPRRGSPPRLVDQALSPEPDLVQEDPSWLSG